MLLILLQSEKMEGLTKWDEAIADSDGKLGPAVTAAANGMCSPRFRSLHPESPTATSGNFFEALTSSDLYKNTKVTVFFKYLYHRKFLNLRMSLNSSFTIIFYA